MSLRELLQSRQILSCKNWFASFPTIERNLHLREIYGHKLADSHPAKSSRFLPFPHHIRGPGAEIRSKQTSTNTAAAKRGYRRGRDFSNNSAAEGRAPLRFKWSAVAMWIDNGYDGETRCRHLNFSVKAGGLCGAGYSRTT